MTLTNFVDKDVDGTGGSKGNKPNMLPKLQALVTEVNVLTNGLVHNISTVSTATYDVLETDEYLYVTRTATGTCAIDLPTAQVVAGRTIYIKDASGNADTFAITVSTEGAETIDGAATQTISSDYGTMMVFCDGTNWDMFTDRPYSDDTKIPGPGAVTDHALVRFDGITGLLVQNGTATYSDAGELGIVSVDIGSSTVISGVLDEDAMGSDSAVSLATQQSIKAYADLKVLGPGTVVNNTIVRYDGTTGLLVQESDPTIDDNGGVAIGTSGSPLDWGALAGSNSGVQAHLTGDGAGAATGMKGADFRATATAGTTQNVIGTQSLATRSGGVASTTELYGANLIATHSGGNVINSHGAVGSLSMGAAATHDGALWNNSACGVLAYLYVDTGATFSGTPIIASVIAHVADDTTGNAPIKYDAAVAALLGGDTHVVNAIAAFKAYTINSSGGLFDYGLDLGDLDTVAIADFRGVLGDTINNMVAGTWNFATSIVASTGLTNAGAMIKNTTVVNVANYNLLATDEILLVTRTATGVCAIDLPSAQVVAGRQIIISDAGGNANAFNITVTTEAGELIDGAATAVINGDYDSYTLISDGVDWLSI